MRSLSLLLACVFVLAACAGNQQADTAETGYVDGSGATAFAPDERDAAPHVEGETLDGEQLSLDQLDGPVLVNFWASWCGPCAREAPHLAAIHDEYGERGVHVLGVNVKDQRANAQTFVRDHGKDYPSLYDEAAAVAASFGGIGPAALPSTIILDADHRVAVRLFGAVSAAQLSPHLEEILAEQGAAGAAADEGGDERT
jgi:thiol-disulfide isomerase/thioredoxin